MPRGLAAAMVAALAATASAKECVTLLDAAKKAGVTGLYDIASSALSNLSKDSSSVLIDFHDTEYLAEEERITVLLPTDLAIKTALPYISDWTAEDQLFLVFDHMVQGDLESAAIRTAVQGAAPKPFVAPIVTSNPYYFTASGADLFVTPGEKGFPQSYSDVKAKVVKTNIETCVGTLHVIDAVLIPLICQDGYCDAEYEGGAYGAEVHGAYGAYGAEGKGMPAHKAMDKGMKDMMMQGKRPVSKPVAAAGAKATDEPVVKTGSGSVSTSSGSVSTSSGYGSSGSGSSSGGSSSGGSSGSTSSRSSGSDSFGSSDTETSSGSSGGLSGAAVGGIAAGAAAAVVAAVAAGVVLKARYAGGAAAASGALSV